MLVGSYGGQIKLRTSSDIFVFSLGLRFWRVVLRERYTLKGQIAFEGHSRLQSWTLFITCVQYLRDVWIIGPLHTRDWGPVTTALQALSLVETAELVQVCFTLCLMDQRGKWMQGGSCKVYMDSCMASNGLFFIVTWTISHNQFLKVGLTQTQETMAWQMII